MDGVNAKSGDGVLEMKKEDTLHTENLLYWSSHVFSNSKSTNLPNFFTKFSLFFIFSGGKTETDDFDFH